MFPVLSEGRDNCYFFNLDSSFFPYLNSYGHYAEGTGSVLKMADIDVRCALGRSFLKSCSLCLLFDVPSLGDIIWCGILPIESLFFSVCVCLPSLFFFN